MVLDVDAENKRISLGVKQLVDDPWPGISERFAPGVEPAGRVVRVQDKGVVVDLGDEIEGFVPASHSGVEDPERLEEYYVPGDPVPLRVIESDAANRRIVLEVTEAPERKPQEQIEAARAAARAEAAARTAQEGHDAPEEGEPDDDRRERKRGPRKPPAAAKAEDGKALPLVELAAVVEPAAGAEAASEGGPTGEDAEREPE
jgi:small subunit ribosomal protein S1